MGDNNETSRLAPLYKHPIGQLARILLGTALPPEILKAVIRYQALQLIADEMGVYRDDQGNEIPTSARMKPIAEVEQDIAAKADGVWQAKVSEAEQVIGLNASLQLPSEIPPFNAVLSSGVTGYSMDRSISDDLLLFQAGIRAHALLDGKVDFFAPKIFEKDPESLQKIQAAVIKGMQAVKEHAPLPADLGALGNEAILLATRNLKDKGIDVVRELEAYFTVRTSAAQAVSRRSSKRLAAPSVTVGEINFDHGIRLCFGGRIVPINEGNWPVFSNDLYDLLRIGR